MQSNEIEGLEEKLNGEGILRQGYIDLSWQSVVHWGKVPSYRYRIASWHLLCQESSRHLCWNWWWDSTTLALPQSMAWSWAAMFHQGRMAQVSACQGSSFNLWPSVLHGQSTPLDSHHMGPHRTLLSVWLSGVRPSGLLTCAWGCSVAWSTNL